VDTGLKNKVVLLTGGAGGIGRACALAFAQEGARIAVADVNLPAAEAVAREIGDQAASLAIRVDVTQPESVQAMFAAVVAQFGQVDVLVNGAGIFHRTPIDDLSADAWEQLMAINLRGTFLCSQAALKVMKSRGTGNIINIASMGGQVGGLVAGADYSASKAGVLCFTKSLAKNAGPHGINVNAVNPGVIDTEMTRPWGPDLLNQRIAETPLRRLGTAEEVAWVIVFLASRQASFVHGTHVDVNGGIYMD
jgi:3-oxoacyl-[acyl-carrier protein] reductase